MHLVYSKINARIEPILRKLFSETYVKIGVIP